MSDGGGMGDMMMMQMWFTNSYEVTLLFKAWSTTSRRDYALALVLVGVFCLFHELIYSMRLRQRSRIAMKAKGGLSSSATDRFIMSGLYTVSVFTHYTIMLLAMTFNVGVFVVILFSHCIGNAIVTQPNFFNLLSKRTVKDALLSDGALLRGASEKDVYGEAEEEEQEFPSPYVLPPGGDCHCEPI